MLSAAGQRPQRGVAVQAAVRLRRDGGVAARVGGLRGHGRDVVGRRGGGGGGGLRGAVDHCGTCAARNTRCWMDLSESRARVGVMVTVKNGLRLACLS